MYHQLDTIGKVALLQRRLQELEQQHYLMYIEDIELIACQADSENEQQSKAYEEVIQRNRSALAQVSTRMKIVRQALQGLGVIIVERESDAGDDG